MWLFVLSILLITTSIVHGSEDSQLAIKELHYEISKVAREVQELYVEPDTAQIELDEKAKKVLEEYIQIDISSGLPEQVKLLDLKDKAEDVKTSEETRKAVVDGLDYLGNVKEMKSDENKLLDVVVRELKAMEKAKEVKIHNIDTTIKTDLIYHMLNSRTYYDMALGLSFKIDARSEINKPAFEDTLKYIKDDYERFKRIYEDLLEELKKFTSRLPDIDHIAFDFPNVMKNDIEGGKEKIEEIRKLKEEFDLSQKILSVKGEIKLMEELRDCEAIQKLLDFMEKVKGSYESIKGSGLDHFEWKISYFAQKWVPIQNYLKNLNVPTGDLTESLTKIEECLQAFDFSMDFSIEETESLKLEEAFKDVRSKKDIYFDIIENVEVFKSLRPTLESMMKWIETEPKDWDEFKKNLMEIERRGNVKLLARVPELDVVLLEFQTLLKKLDTAVFDSIKTVSEGITSKISKIKEFLNCSSSLKIEPSEVKSLMDQPKEVWNFDARPLESVLEVVYLFKEAHRFLSEKKPPVPIDGFPLTKEEVTGISDGLGILKAILDYQKLWNEIPLTEELIQLEIHSNLPSVPFPKDNDSLINFYSTQYQGPQRRRILKILEGVKDYSQFTSKLEKMNEAVGKWKNWRKEQNPDEQNVDGAELIDCAERTCELALPEVNPEERTEL
ncbi:unnamed protein product [Caenorhabditis brenneri]